MAHIGGMSKLPARLAPDLDVEMTALAHNYDRANGPFLKLINSIGGEIGRAHV